MTSTTNDNIHVMVDLETLDTKGTGMFLSIAAIAFNLVTGVTSATFYATIDMHSAMRLGLTIDPETLKWWMKQRKDALAQMLEGSTDITKVLNEFRDWFIENKGLYMWGNSARFDLGMLANAYERLGVPVPWNTRTFERCYKTYAKDYGHLIAWEEIDEARFHDPVYDCGYQIRHLVKLRALIDEALNEHKLNH